MISLDQTWAKTDPATGKPVVTVIEHSLNAHAVGESLSKLVESFGIVRPVLPWSLALHDIGKICLGFQCKSDIWLLQQNLSHTAKVENWRGASCTNHGQVTGQYLLSLPQRVSPAYKKLAILVASHHGHILRAGDCQRAREVPKHRDSMAKLRRTCHEILASQTGIPLELDDHGIPSTDGLLFALAGWTCICDWIASDEKFFRPGEPVTPDIARNNANLAMQSLGWFQQPVRFSRFESIFTNQSPRPLQNKLAELADRPGIYIVEAQMGDGKTKAALWATHNLMSKGLARGLYFALPTQVTSERVLDEAVRPFVENGFEAGAVARLAHSAAWLREAASPRILAMPEYDSDPPRPAEDWFSGGKRTLLAPFAVGTIDQALIGVLPRKHFFVRIAGLAGKVVVLDEVHSYDIYTGTLLCKLIELLSQCGCTIIVLSATLASHQRAALLAAAGFVAPGSIDWDTHSTLITSGQWHEREEKAHSRPVAKVKTCEASFLEMKVGISCVRKDTSQIASELVHRARSGQKVLWIRNSVGNAIDAFNVCASVMASIGSQLPCGLLHSRFTWLDRQANETAWIERFQASDTTNGCILIATQVAEQSLNLDADFLVTDLAPTDLILQRIGRLWRFRDRPRPTGCTEAQCWINSPDLDNLNTAKGLKDGLAPLAKVYAPYVLLRSFEIWENLNHISLPGDIRALVEATYSHRLPEDEPMPGWEDLAKEARQEATKVEELAKGLSDIWNRLTLDLDDDDAQTRRIRFPTLPLVLLKTPLAAPSAHPWVFADGTEVLLPKSGCRFADTVSFRRAVMENSVKIPKWLLPRGDDWFPPALRQIPGLEAAVAWVEGARVLPWGCPQSSEGNWLAGFSYTTARGLAFPSQSPTKASAQQPEQGEEDWW